MSFEKEEHLEHPPTAHMPGLTMPPEKHISFGKLVVVVLVAIAIVAGVIYTGIRPRMNAMAALTSETNELAAPTVALVQPQRGTPAQEIVLPGSIEAFISAPIYARTNGYLKKWYVDIGAKVKAGQLLAEIETPEVDQQMLQAKADLATAQANAQLAQTTAARYTDLLKTDSVSKQDTDNAVSDAEAKKSAVKSAEANLNRLEQMQSFQKIFAPFDGVITARRTDIGQLIDSGSSAGAAHELFNISAVDKLRVYVDVPQVYSHSAVPGVAADLTFAEMPGRKFPGRLVRTSNSIDANTRTMRVEVDVDNASGTLLPGAYTEVHLKIQAGVPTLLLPVSAVMFRSEGLRVVTIVDGNKAKLLPITLGRDFGNQVEIVSGLDESQSVVESPPDSLIDGMAVRVVTKKDQTTAPGTMQSSGAAKK